MISGLAQAIKKAGYKLTPARLAVIEVLENSQDHPCHNQILEAGRGLYPKLSRATVYRTLEILVELNLVRPLYLTEPTQRFMPALGGHHHLVCDRCGRVVEFEECVTGPLAQQLASQHKFRIHSHLLEFRGICEGCLDN